ncbi:MAG: AMP-binding protein [Immundisolibacter sp.]|uniref:AMP-binding protein n=1 Tax=Immundisolibacter sp. TaxID=1934948 RepID=UPI003EE0C39F
MSASTTDLVIHKPPASATRAIPNQPDYAKACARFSWAVERLALLGLPGGGINIAVEAVDRHLSNFANVLGGLGIQPGERVFSLLGRVPELYLTALGTLKAGAVFCPMFSAFGAGATSRAAGNRRRAGSDGPTPN